MIAAWWALLAATAAIAVGDFCNRRVIGWLPDDPPRPGRKQHLRPMPLAGVLVLPAIVPWCVADEAWLPLAAMLLAAAIGFVDDRRKERAPTVDDDGGPADGGLDWKVKAIGLLVAAGLVAANAHDPLASPGWFAAALAFVFVLTNAVNFLDNTDGVAAGLSATMLLCFALGVGGAPPWITAAGCAALAFVPWNWPTPRLFLGDGGAYVLGLAAGLASVGQWRQQPDVVWIVALPLVDFVQVVCARLWLGHPPWVGDRRHVTHILQNVGVPRRAVAPIVCAAALLLALLFGPAR